MNRIPPSPSKREHSRSSRTCLIMIIFLLYPSKTYIKSISFGSGKHSSCSGVVEVVRSCETLYRVAIF